MSRLDWEHDMNAESRRKGRCRGGTGVGLLLVVALAGMSAMGQPGLEVSRDQNANAARSGVSTSDAVQWPVSEGGNGHWYGFSPAFIPWSDTRSAAESVGGYLCCMETAEEWVWIRTEMVEPSADELFSESGWGVCIGGFQNLDSPDYSEPYGGWEWLTGVPFQCGGEFDCNMENYFGVQHNMSLVQEPGSLIQFNDIDEEPDQPYYMIEWSADCNGDGIVDYGQILDGTYEDANGNGVPDCCDADEPCDDSDGDAVQWKVEDGGNGHWYEMYLLKPTGKRLPMSQSVEAGISSRLLP